MGNKFILALLFCLVATIGHAASSVDVKNFDNNTVFRITFIGTADTIPDFPSTRDLGSEDMAAVLRAVQYWTERVMPRGAPSEVVQIYVRTIDEVEGYYGGPYAVWSFDGKFAGGVEGVLVDKQAEPNPPPTSLMAIFYWGFRLSL